MISIQESLFQLIKGSLPPNISFVHAISELLGISYDSVYRRIRGEKELTLEELKAICMDGRRVCYNTYNVINQLITTSPVFCDQIEKSLRILMQKSTMISGTSSKERHRFFNTLHEKVKMLRSKIERMA